MRSWLRPPYHVASKAAELLARVAPRESSSKLVRTFAARRDVVARYEAWGERGRNPAQPLVWVHAPSVGEGLMALPVLQTLRAELPHVQLAYTFFSPSAERFAATLDVDFSAYLPFDTVASADRTLQALRPNVLVFSKLDVWPMLTERTHERGVKLGLISASVPADSARTRGIGAAFTRSAYAQLDLAGTASEEDAQNLAKAGVRQERIRVTGDTRYDQAWARAHEAPQHTALVTSLRSERFTLVAGSTWPADETPLLDAWTRFRTTSSHARLIIAPHEIHTAHIQQIESWATSHHLIVARIDDAQAPHADVIIVDRIGLLADLYALADVAYVGGGFHTRGLHSVVEPAVFHVPTIVGPHSTNSRDAQLLRAAGGLIVVSTAEELAETLGNLATWQPTYDAMQEQLANVVSLELGATRRSVDLVRELLGGM